jgi:protein-disulfide isomerase
MIRRRKSITVFLGLAVLTFLLVNVGFSQSTGELESFKTELEDLKAGQQEMQKELKAIKELLKQRPPARQAQPPIQPVDLELNLANSPAKGDQAAPVVLVEFSDYQCPFCGRAFENTFPEIDKHYIQTGKVKYVFRDFPLDSIHKDAAKASEAARCAGDQGKYWEMHDQLFAHRKALGLAKLPGYAQTIGLDMPTFQACLDSGNYAEAVRQDLQDGQKAGVRGTPTFFLGRANGNTSTVKATQRLRGAQAYSNFKKAIDTLLAAKSKEGGK